MAARNNYNISDIRELIVKGRLEAALNMLHNSVNSQDTTLLLARYNELKLEARQAPGITGDAQIQRVAGGGGTGPGGDD